MNRFQLLSTWISANIFILVKRRCFMLILLLCVALTLLLVFSLQWGLMCTNIQPYFYVKSVCADFKSGRSVGNLCHDMCEHSDVSSLSCHSFYLGKEAVFSGIWKNMSIVFKLPRRSAANEIQVDWSYDKNYPTEDQFSDMIKTNIKLKFNLSISNVDARKMSYLQNAQHPYNRLIEMANVWSLLQHNEYMGLLLFEKYNFFPKIVGSCGGLFAVQKLNPLSGFWHLITLYDRKVEWIKRIKIAIMVLDFLQTLDNDLLDPLHICDMKMSHFGITDDFKKVQYLDLDFVHPRSIANKITGDGSSCTKHSDCDYFDCRSFCNLITFKCQYGVVNNNLQMVCERVFLGWLVSGRVMMPGLLVGHHTPVSLMGMLESCANPAQEMDTPRAPSSNDMLKRLKNFLEHFIQP